jgi:hypothetical protein
MESDFRRRDAARGSIRCLARVAEIVDSVHQSGLIHRRPETRKRAAEFTGRTDSAGLQRVVPRLTQESHNTRNCRHTGVYEPGSFAQRQRWSAPRRLSRWACCFMNSSLDSSGTRRTVAKTLLLPRWSRAAFRGPTFRNCPGNTAATTCLCRGVQSGISPVRNSR